VKVLLAQEEIEVNTFNKEGGHTPLSIAARHGHLEAIALLLKHGASQLMFENRHCRPLDIIAQRENQIAVLPKALVKHDGKIKTCLLSGLDAEKLHKANTIQERNEAIWKQVHEDAAEAQKSPKPKPSDREAQLKAAKRKKNLDRQRAYL
jgi:ankyrin repeat protein